MTIALRIVALLGRFLRRAGIVTNCADNFSLFRHRRESRECPRSGRREPHRVFDRLGPDPIIIISGSGDERGEVVGSGEAADRPNPVIIISGLRKVAWEVVDGMVNRVGLVRTRRGTGFTFHLPNMV